MDITFRLEEIEAVAAQLLSAAGEARIFALHGNLGAGKTTLVHAIAMALGAVDSVSSPTFSIINEYSLPQGLIYHIDLYRLKDETEAINAGVDECIFSGAWCFIEWPERAPRLFPTSTVNIFLDVLEEQTRRLRLELPSSD